MNSLILIKISLYTAAHKSPTKEHFLPTARVFQIFCSRVLQHKKINLIRKSFQSDVEFRVQHKNKVAKICFKKTCSGATGSIVKSLHWARTYNLSVPKHSGDQLIEIFMKTGSANIAHVFGYNVDRPSSISPAKKTNAPRSNLGSIWSAYVFFQAKLGVLR